MGLQLEIYKTKQFIQDLYEQEARRKKQQEKEKFLFKLTLIGGAILWLLMVVKEII